LQYKEVIRNNTYKNFDMTYFKCPIDGTCLSCFLSPHTHSHLVCVCTEIIDFWNAQGGETWQLIEPVDGFHPNQMANALIGAWFWNQFETNYTNLVRRYTS